MKIVLFTGVLLFGCANRREKDCFECGLTKQRQQAESERQTEKEIQRQQRIVSERFVKTSHLGHDLPRCSGGHVSSDSARPGIFNVSCPRGFIIVYL